MPRLRSRPINIKTTNEVCPGNQGQQSEQRTFSNNSVVKVVIGRIIGSQSIAKPEGGLKITIGDPDGNRTYDKYCADQHLRQGYTCVGPCAMVANVERLVTDAYESEPLPPQKDEFSIDNLFN